MGRKRSGRPYLEECEVVLLAEDAHGELAEHGRRPSRAVASVRGVQYEVGVEFKRHPIWSRGGRVFFTCPACSRRCARLYARHVGHAVRCRRCIGFAYNSQSRTYREGWVKHWGPEVDPLAYEWTEWAWLPAVSHRSVRKGVCSEQRGNS